MADSIARLRACVADFLAGPTGHLVLAGMPKNEVVGSVTNLGAIEHDADVTGLRVPATLFQAVVHCVNQGIVCILAGVQGSIHFR